MNWKKGRGKLGIFSPLLGSWQADADSEMGPVKCRRKFSKELSGKYRESLFYHTQISPIHIGDTYLMQKKTEWPGKFQNKTALRI